MTRTSNKKRYIIRKYVMAKSAEEALKKERKMIPDDVFIDDDWRKENPNTFESAIGFNVEVDD